MDKRELTSLFSPNKTTLTYLREREKTGHPTMTTTTLSFGGNVFLRGVPSALTMRRGRQQQHNSCSCSSSAASKAVFLPSSWRRNNSHNINTRYSIVARSSEKSSSSSNEKKKTKKKTKKKKNESEEKKTKKKKSKSDETTELLLQTVQSLKQEMQKMKLEMRAMEPEREPLVAPSATEVMSGGVYGGESKRSSGSSGKTTTAAPSITQTTQKEKDDYFNKVANDLLTPALGETISNPEMIIVDAANWAGDGTNRGHEWPLLRNGDNDVYLMTLAHAALMESGFWCGEDDTEEMYFGKKTEEAVEIFQGANGPGLEVNGMINTKTWLALLGKEKFEWGPAPGAILDEDVASCREGIARKAFEDTQKKLKAVAAKEDEDPYGEDIDSGPPAEDDFIDVKGSSGDSVEWPILRLDEGGFTVHKMQAMLSTLGFNCGEDDSEYWFMGPDTQNALQTFQASESLPETGVVDFQTWTKLFDACGYTNATAATTIEEAFAMVPENEYSVDRSPGCGENENQGVWLIGEQRYENCQT